MDEYISKAETIEAIRQTYCPNCNSYNGSMCRACGYKDCMDIVDDVKAADVQPVKHSKWIDCTFYDPCEKSWEQNYEFKCSNCGHKIYNKPNDDNLFCGHCSARMDGDSK